MSHSTCSGGVREQGRGCRDRGGALGETAKGGDDVHVRVTPRVYLGVGGNKRKEASEGQKGKLSDEGNSVARSPMLWMCGCSPSDPWCLRRAGHCGVNSQETHNRVGEKVVR